MSTTNARSAIYNGSCLCGCGRPARSRSGFTPLCHDRLWKFERASSRRFREVTGISTPLPRLISTVEHVVPFDPEHEEVLRDLGQLLREIHAGDITATRRRKGATA